MGIAVVTFVTPEYAEYAGKLVASASRFGIQVQVRTRQCLASWERNCGQKAAVISEAWRQNQAQGHGTLWVDADALFRAPLSELELWLDAPWSQGRQRPDVAVLMPEYADASRKRWPEVNSRLCSGTIFFAPTGGARAILNAWQERQSERPTTLDQDVLWDVIQNVSGPLVRDLDPRFCCIPDLMPDVENPVIVHTQASRTMRDRIGSARL